LFAHHPFQGLDLSRLDRLEVLPGQRGSDDLLELRIEIDMGNDLVGERRDGQGARRAGERNMNSE
jgi:hypothetical protein